MICSEIRIRRVHGEAACHVIAAICSRRSSAAFHFDVSQFEKCVVRFVPGMDRRTLDKLLKQHRRELDRLAESQEENKQLQEEQFRVRRFRLFADFCAPLHA